MKVPMKSLNAAWKVGYLPVAGEGRRLQIRYAVYRRNPDVLPDSFVVFLNGRSEWIEKNMELADDLQLPDTVGFLTLDHRGQGGSEGTRAYVARYDDYVTDVVALIKKEVGELPYVMLAHSMGGLIATYGCLRGDFAPKALVLFSPLFKLRDVPMPNFLAKLISRLLSAMGFAKVSSGAGSYDRESFATNSLTHDEGAYLLSAHSPYRLPSATFGWVAATFAALDYIYNEKNIVKLAAPTLVFSPEDERVVDRAGHARWCQLAARLSTQQVICTDIPTARHELLSETAEYRSPVINEARAWILRALGQAG